MTINITREKHTVSLFTLEPGQCFLLNEELHMVTRLSRTDFPDLEERPVLYCVHLDSGRLVSIGRLVQVEEVAAMDIQVEVRLPTLAEAET